MQLDSATLSTALYIQRDLLNDNGLLVVCNWCSKTVVSYEDQEDMPNQDWIAIMVNHFTGCDEFIGYAGGKVIV